MHRARLAIVTYHQCIVFPSTTWPDIYSQCASGDRCPTRQACRIYATVIIAQKRAAPRLHTTRGGFVQNFYALSVQHSAARSRLDQNLACFAKVARGRNTVFPPLDGYLV